MGRSKAEQRLLSRERFTAKMRMADLFADLIAPDAEQIIADVFLLKNFALTQAEQLFNAISHYRHSHLFANATLGGYFNVCGNDQCGEVGAYDRKG